LLVEASFSSVVIERIVAENEKRPRWIAPPRAFGLFVSSDDSCDDNCGNRLATFADGEAVSVGDRDRLFQVDSLANAVTWHRHLAPSPGLAICGASILVKAGLRRRASPTLDLL